MPYEPVSPLPPLREVIQRYDLGARKALGQHFLLDQNLTDRIVRSAGELAGKTVIEVGPGPGGLTRSLLASDAAAVIAVEKDQRCITALAELEAAFPGRLTLHHADALAPSLSSLGKPPRLIVANLPYNVSTALLVHWLQEVAQTPGVVTQMILMFQKEVAERLTATPGSKQYGRLSVLTSWLCEARHLFDIPRQAFTPPPKVTSTVVALTPRADLLAPALIKDLEKVTAAAFGQRRKMLRQSLKSLGVESKTLLSATGIDETSRAETLSVGDFCALARAFRATVGGSPRS
ncbi:MAG: 16S rRNA (adenine(1518)-N(6)/adenine(1519)-N(6))-dimethyltransferase RsmA [Pseudomonadota bacterium]